MVKLDHQAKRALTHPAMTILLPPRRAAHCHAVPAAKQSQGLCWHSMCCILQGAVSVLWARGAKDVLSRRAPLCPAATCLPTPAADEEPATGMCLTQALGATRKAHWEGMAVRQKGRVGES